MTAFVDGDLASEQSAWLRSHLEACDECRGMLARLIEIDRELTDWGERWVRENPAPSGERERLTARLVPALKQPLRRNMSMALAIAAVLTLAVALSVTMQKKITTGNPATNRGEEQFVEIPYLAPLDPRENATIVRMDIQVATLLAAGYRVTADPDAIVPADVLVGEDGRAHAVRLLSGVSLNGAGD
jgi:anti-sigma factor RsiW